MRLVTTIMLLNRKALSISSLFTVLALASATAVQAQDNSPYSRYGIGNLVPNTNVNNRGMGGISAAYADFMSINFNNPASYSRFQALLEERSRQMASGRVLLDVGLNIENRTLREPNQPIDFTSTNALFSHVQIGLPLRKNWGLSFGLRPISRISYKVDRHERLMDGVTGQPIDTALTQFNGSGGTFLPSIGTGFAIGNFSLGANVGYLFGRKEFGTRRALLNDSVSYFSSNHSTNASFGDVYLNAGAQYRFKINRQTTLSLGVSGNLQQDISGTQDVTREVYTNTVIDTVYHQTGLEGAVTYPASFTGGFVLENTFGNTGSFLVGADLTQTKWSNYRYFGAIDSVQDNWQLRVGGHFRPNAKAGSGYWNNVTYRAGFFVGPDYIRVGNDIPTYGITMGLALPLANYNRLSPYQFTTINVALEYERRGNNDNILKENMFRISLGLNFSDLWFTKRKYD